MTLVAVKYGLARIATGDILDVILVAGEPLENIPRAVSEQGHKVLEIREENEKRYRVVIEKVTNN
jgi:tRNA 2-thiouridine synthesizing protein A